MATVLKGVSMGVPLLSFVAKQQEVISWIKILDALLFLLQNMPRYGYIFDMQILYTRDINKFSLFIG